VDKTHAPLPYSRHDGSNPELPILLSISGKVLDVTKGKKFYAPGKTYNQFAGRACTRALALGSLDLNVNVSYILYSTIILCVTFFFFSSVSYRISVIM
jgi:hypothetical protein